MALILLISVEHSVFPPPLNGLLCEFGWTSFIVYSSGIKQRKYKKYLWCPFLMSSIVDLLLQRVHCFWPIHQSNVCKSYLFPLHERFTTASCRSCVYEDDMGRWIWFGFFWMAYILRVCVSCGDFKMRPQAMLSLTHALKPRHTHCSFIELCG